MPIIDDDIIQVHAVSRTGGVLKITFNYRDGQTNEDQGRHQIELNGIAEVRRFLKEANREDALRALLNAAIDRADDSLRPTVFDALAGKTFRVQQRVQQV